MVGNKEELLEETIEEIHMNPVWPWRLKEERGTTTCTMTQVH
jgi:hypothetical protein